MTVVVSGAVADVTGRADSRPWKAWSPVYRSGSSGEVINIRPQKVTVSGGEFVGEFEPGVLVLENPEQERYTVMVPDTDTTLWSLIIRLRKVGCDPDDRFHCPRGVAPHHRPDRTAVPGHPRLRCPDGLMHTLYHHGFPIARSDRWQYLCMLMAAYSADEQRFMEIR